MVVVVVVVVTTRILVIINLFHSVTSDLASVSIPRRVQQNKNDNTKSNIVDIRNCFYFYLTCATEDEHVAIKFYSPVIKTVALSVRVTHISGIRVVLRVCLYSWKSF